MPFLIVATDKPDSSDLRQQTRAAHLAYLAENADRLVLAGAQWTDDAQTAVGSVLVLDVDTREDAEAFAAADPYAQAGLFASVTVSVYRVAYLDKTSRLPA